MPITRSYSGVKTLRYTELVTRSQENVQELMPWDLEEALEEQPDLMILDVREPYEFQAMHIKGSINVPRGILESACEWDYEETVPDLVRAREKDIVVVCRSGNRSVFACEVMQWMGYRKVRSLRTGLRGWADYEQLLVDGEDQTVSEEDSEEYFASHVREDQLRPKD